jgi:Secretion system C-terminal sorting domain
LDTNLNCIWAVSPEGYLNPLADVYTKDNNIYIGGTVQDTSIYVDTTYYPYAYMNLFIYKYDSSGLFQWGKIISPYPTGAIANIGLCQVASDTCSNVWICGFLGCKLKLDDTTFIDTTTYYSPSTADPLYVVQYSSEGTLMNYMLLRAGGDDANGMICDKFNNLYIDGDYAEDTFPFGTDTLFGIGTPIAEANFIAKLSLDYSCSYRPLAEKKITEAGLFHIYPNPTENSLHIESKEEIKCLELYDMYGRMLHRFFPDAFNFEINVKELSSGIYLIKANDGLITKFIRR